MIAPVCPSRNPRTGLADREAGAVSTITRSESQTVRAQRGRRRSLRFPGPNFRGGDRTHVSRWTNAIRKEGWAGEKFEPSTRTAALPAPSRMAWLLMMGLVGTMVAVWLLPWNFTPYGAAAATMFGFDASHQAVIERGLNRHWNSTWVDPGRSLRDLTVVRGRVYGIRRASALVALSAKNGRLVWRRRLSGVANAPLLVVGGRVVLTTRGTHPQVVAFSAADGRRLWSRPLGGPAMAAASGGKLWLVGDGGVAKRSLYGGRLLWWLPVSGLTNPLPPIIAGRMLYFGGENRGRWYRLNLAERRLTWTLSLPAMVRSGVAAAGGKTIYIPGVTRQPGGEMFSLVAVSEADGSVLWRRTLGAVGSATGVGLPVLVGPACYLANPGTELVYAVRRTSGRLLWQDVLNRATLATVPLDVAGQLVVGDRQGRLWDLRASSGQVVSALRLPGAGFPVQMPFIAGKTLYASTFGANGGLLALQLGRVVPSLARGYPIPIAF